jgi:hypothetical protein
MVGRVITHLSFIIFQKGSPKQVTVTHTPCGVFYLPWNRDSTTQAPNQKVGDRHTFLKTESMSRGLYKADENNSCSTKLDRFDSMCNINYSQLHWR